MKMLQNIFLAVTLMMPFHLTAEQVKDDPIELLLDKAMFKIEEAKTFEQKLEILKVLEKDLGNLDEPARDSEFYNYVQLTEVLSVVKLSELTQVNCTEALGRIGYGWDPTSEVPRLSGMVELVYDIIQHLCFFDTDSSC
ncbi:hypothetical protein [Neptuniibacter halophilus]|uniref:hypothetical protein n=1 Tax=Neptuniibacter halophilus TaxID=651666 RepID=UPI0025738FA1|nr:hypothetical protein [Neptuniibacter halophilus]